MSVLSTSPQDNRLFSAEIAAALEDINAAVIVQQLHYWMGKESVGTVIKGVKYIYNSFNDWVKQFPWLSVWQFRKAMDKLRSLGIVEVIRYKAKCWNQTNYYTLNSDRLFELLNSQSSKTIEKSELCATTDRDEDISQIEVSDSTLSLLEQRKTNQKETAKTEERSLSNESNLTAAASSSLKNASDQNNSQKERNTHLSVLDGLKSQDKGELKPKQITDRKESKFRDRSINVTKNLNPEWKSLIEELDSVGVSINKTLVSLVKMYSEEEVKNAIALLKIRKQEKHIPNLAGYFTAALKGGWSCSKVVVDKEEVDTATIFRLWFDLAKELGYCTGREIRDGEQWVLISGSWEKWRDASDRGYSLEYLKKVKARNRGC